MGAYQWTEPHENDTVWGAVKNRKRNTKCFGINGVLMEKMRKKNCNLRINCRI